MNPSAGPRTHRRTYPNINVHVHFDAFLPAKHEDLPVDSTAHPHTHRCNRLSSYLFILKLSFRLTTNTYLSTHLQYYISTVPPPLHAPPPPPPPPPSLLPHPVHQPTCSVEHIPSGSKCTFTCQLICRSAYPQIYPKMNLLVHLNASLPANNEDPHVQSATSLHVHGCPLSHKRPVHFDAFIPVNHKDLLFDLIVLHDHRCTCSSTDLFILILSFRLTGTVCRSASLLLYIHTQVYPSFSIYLFSLIFPSGKTRSFMSTHLLVYVPTDVPENKSTCICGWFSSG